MASSTTVTHDPLVVPSPRVQPRSCALTVIVEADAKDADLGRKVRRVQAGLDRVDSQLIVACEEPWDDAPAGVEVVAYESAGKGDRYDAASRFAGGSLLAFVDSNVTFSPDWAQEVLQIFSDPEVVVAGGPVTPRGASRGERVSALVMTHYLAGSPTAHNSKVREATTVREVGSSNLVIRTAAFRTVGGFQAPPGGGGEAVRLCYKVRALLGGRIVSEPGMALSAPAPAFPGPLLRDIGIYGRFRGAMARRLPEAAPLFPYALPSLLTGLLAVTATLVFVAGPGVVRTSLFAIVATVVLLFVVQSARMFRGPETLGDRLLAALALPVVLLVFGLAFLRGFLGRSVEEMSPPRDRVKPLRVMILNWRDVTHPYSGGAETYMHQLARRWAADGMDVGWLTQRHSGSARNEVIDRVRIHRVGGRLTLYPRVALCCLTRMRGRFDLIIDCENGIPFFSPFFTRKPKILLVHHVHQEIFRTQVPRQLRWLALWLEGSLMPWAYRRTHVVAVSEGTRSDLADLGFEPRRISIVTNGVNPPKPTTHAPAPHPTILCMGRLKPQKSVDVLIRAMPAMIEEVPDLHVDIVGQGPDRNRLERLAWSLGLAKHIQFHGYVRAAVRDEIAAAAWVSVCPSAFEGWGVVCMEASARGLPVVASNVAGLKESVRDGETGLLVPYGDEAALAAALLSLLQDPERRTVMGDAGRRWAAKHTWNGSASEFVSLMDSVTGRHGPGDEPVASPVIDLSGHSADREPDTLAAR